MKKNGEDKDLRIERVKRNEFNARKLAAPPKIILLFEKIRRGALKISED